MEGEACADNGLIKVQQEGFPKVCSYFDIKSTVYYAELDICTNNPNKEP